LHANYQENLNYLIISGNYPVNRFAKIQISG